MFKYGLPLYPGIFPLQAQDIVFEPLLEQNVQQWKIPECGLNVRTLIENGLPLISTF